MVSKANIHRDLAALMLIPGLSGHEGRVRRFLRKELASIGFDSTTDMSGNLTVSIKGKSQGPSVMLIAHMDQLGFIVRKIDADGFVRLERVGGVPERALASQPVLFQIGEGRDRCGVIGNMSHHATPPDKKYEVVPYQQIYVDTGLTTAEEVRGAGIEIGTPVVYKPHIVDLPPDRIAGTSVDDRAGCAVLLELLRLLKKSAARLPTIHLVFSVQEEFNLRGALSAVQMLKPDIAIQLDLLLTGDTPDMGDRTEVKLGDGPGISLYSFHGRGTLNGTLPHPALPKLFDEAARRAKLNLQRSVQSGVLTETSYVQLAGKGVACIDVGFPCRYTHSALEVCDLNDLEGLAQLLGSALPMIGADFSLNRDDFEQ